MTETQEKAKHTPEPWHIERRHDGKPFGIGFAGMKHDIDIICSIHHQGDSAEPNANRIVACVNELKDINPKAVPKLVEALLDAQLKLTGALQWIEDAKDRCTEVVTVDYDGSGATDGTGLMTDIENSIDRCQAALAGSES